MRSVSAHLPANSRAHLAVAAAGAQRLSGAPPAQYSQGAVPWRRETAQAQPAAATAVRPTRPDSAGGDRGDGNDDDEDEDGSGSSSDAPANRGSSGSGGAPANGGRGGNGGASGSGGGSSGDEGSSGGQAAPSSMPPTKWDPERPIQVPAGELLAAVKFLSKAAGGGLASLGLLMLGQLKMVNDTKQEVGTVGKKVDKLEETVGGVDKKVDKLGKGGLAL